MPVKKTKTYNPQKCGSMINAIAEVNAEIEQIEKEMKKDGYCDVRGETQISKVRIFLNFYTGTNFEFIIVYNSKIWKK